MADRRRTIFLVLVPLATALGALALAEVALRVFAPVYTVEIQIAYQYDPELAFRVTPGVHRNKLTDHLEEIRTNALGTQNFEERFDAYPVLLFAVGDSYTQGTGNSSDTSSSFPLDLLSNQDKRGLLSLRPDFRVTMLSLTDIRRGSTSMSLRAW